MQVRAFNISVSEGREPRSISIWVIDVPAWVPAIAVTNMSAIKGMGQKLVSTKDNKRLNSSTKVLKDGKLWGRNSERTVLNVGCSSRTA